MRTISTSKPNTVLKKKLCDLFGLAIVANTSEDFDIWFELTGHVDWIELRICPKRSYRQIFQERMYYQGSMYEPKKCDAIIKRCTQELLKIINPQ